MHLQKSVNISGIESKRFGNVTAVGAGVSSVSLLGNIRGDREKAAILEVNTTTNVLAGNANILSRLKRLFLYPNAKYSTSDILLNFQDVGDQFAAVFRDMLRTVAKLQDGKWVRK